MSRSRVPAALATLAVVAAATLATGTGPALAQGKPLSCVVDSTTSYPGLTTTAQKFPVEDIGTVTLRRDAVNDGLVITKVTAATGWKKSVEIPSGPKVEAQFRRNGVKKTFEAAQSAAYYGPDILVVEIKTCS